MDETPETVRPQSVAEVFFAFNRLALQGFGGVLAIAQRELVERLRWMTREQYLETLAIGQVLPGPNIVNMALMIGDGFFGMRGAFAAMAGLLVAPTVIVFALVAVYAGFAGQPIVAGALRGMGAVAAGLVIATALKLAPVLKRSPLGVPLVTAFALLTFVGIALLRWPLVWVIGGLGPVAILLAWRALK